MQKVSSSSGVLYDRSGYSQLPLCGPGSEFAQKRCYPWSPLLFEIKKIKLAKKMSFKRMTEVSDLPLSSV